MLRALETRMDLYLDSLKTSVYGDYWQNPVDNYPPYFADTEPRNKKLTDIEVSTPLIAEGLNWPYGNLLGPVASEQEVASLLRKINFVVHKLAAPSYQLQREDENGEEARAIDLVMRPQDFKVIRKQSLPDLVVRIEEQLPKEGLPGAHKLWWNIVSPRRGTLTEVGINFDNYFYLEVDFDPTLSQTENAQIHSTLPIPIDRIRAKEFRVLNAGCDLITYKLMEASIDRIPSATDLADLRRLTLGEQSSA